jgi:hypothetical protein
MGLYGAWLRGPSPDFPSLVPESTDEHDHYFRCPDCGNLVAVGRWLRDGMMFECDVGGCLGQFYAALGTIGAPTDDTPNRGRNNG